MDNNKASIPQLDPESYSSQDQRSGNGKGILRTTLAYATLVFSLVLTSCGASANTPNPISTQPPASQVQQTTEPTQGTIPTVGSPIQNTTTPNQASTPAATSAPQSITANTSLDPCLLITSDEASKIAGASYGTGKEGNTPGGLRICTYGSQTANVLTVDVYQAPDTATAKTDKDQFLADLQASMQQLSSEGLKVTEVPSFADGATIATANINVGGVTINGSAIAFLKGTTFFGFSDIVQNGPAPTSDALKTEATAVLGRLP